VCFFCGEFVVGCVADLVLERPLIEVRKIRHSFHIYFLEEF